MTDTLLQTKLYIPQRPLDDARFGLVPRPRLIEKLNAGLWQGDTFARKLTLVSAPAGFGKTTLIAAWGAQLADSTNSQMCWYSLDEDDNDVQQFFSYLAALIRPLPNSQSFLSQLLQAPQPLPSKTLLKAFLNDSAPVSTPFLLVLDDFHFIKASEISTAVAFLLDHLPLHMHLVIITRADPLLPLPRLRVRRQLTEIRAADLRLTAGETAVFLNDLMQLDLTPDDIITLETRTEGWVAGLQLAALSLEKLEDDAKQRFVAALSGDDRYILDYLLDEVLRQQPTHIQHFLLKTAVLDRFCAPLCDHLRLTIDDLQVDSPPTIVNPKSEIANQNGQNILQALERANLFLVPLDNKRGWYRYHHLFADLLYNQLQATDKTQIPRLHKQASQWYEDNGFLTDAYNHALKAQDIDYAVQLLKRHARDLLVRAKLVTLVDWLNKLPATRLATEPQLCLYHAWAATTLLRLNTAVAALKRIETYTKSTLLPANEIADWQGQVAIVNGLIASKQLDIAQMVTLSQQGLAQLTPDNLLLRGLAVSNLATAQWFVGHTAVACEAIIEAIALNQEAGNITETINLYGILAQSTFEMGQLLRTELICQQALGLIASYADGKSLPSAGFIYVQLGQLFREWNQLEKAVAYVQKGIQLSQDESIGNLLMLRMLLAVLQGEQGDEESALAELNKIQQLSQSMAMPRIMEQAADIQAYIHLQRREVTAVAEWIAAANITADDKPTHFQEQRYLIFADMLIQQKRWPEAEKLLALLRQMAEEGGRTGRLVHISILSTLVQYHQGNNAQATAVLQHTLTLTEPAGYMRIFINAGQPMVTLLNKIIPTDARQQRYIQQLQEALLHTHKDKNQKSKIENRQLVEPLSERELEVLRLVSNGRSNRQIADELFLAIGTIKKHISNIFGKLQVSSRTQAVARARELDIL